jgi:hypothetical protein
MKRISKGNTDVEMLKEYDFSKGIRGKYAKRYREGTNVVILDPDVSRVFPDSRSVNTTLRSVAQILSDLRPHESFKRK